MKRFRSPYVLIALFSVITGLLIFFFVHGGFIRNYGGDIIAIVFLYSVLRATVQPKPIIAAACVLAVAIIVELIQASVSLPHSTLATLTVGSTFDPLDLLTYFVTALVISLLDYLGTAVM